MMHNKDVRKKNKGGIYMKIQNLSVENIDKFFDVVKDCKGRVELVTEEGDRLNLKSKLTQYVSLAKIFSNGELIKEMELIASDPEDASKLISFMING